MIEINEDLWAKQIGESLAENGGGEEAKEIERKLIEKKKFDSNTEKAKELDKEFIYLTEYITKIITWNITNLVRVNYNFKWEERQMPRTTEFLETEPILKEVGYLYEKYAKKY